MSWNRRYQYSQQIEDEAHAYALRKANRKANLRGNSAINEDEYERIFYRKAKKLYKKKGFRRKKSWFRKFLEFMFPWLED